MRSIRLKILAGLTLAAGAAFLTFTAISECTMVTGNQDVAINAFAHISGSARLFRYTDDAGKQLRFVLARGNDGKVRSVFDACRQWFTFHKGYRTPGGEISSRVCGNPQPIDRMRP